MTSSTLPLTKNTDLFKVGFCVGPFLNGLVIILQWFLGSVDCYTSLYLSQSGNCYVEILTHTLYSKKNSLLTPLVSNKIESKSTTVQMLIIIFLNILFIGQQKCGLSLTFCVSRLLNHSFFVLFFYYYESLIKWIKRLQYHNSVMWFCIAVWVWPRFRLS